MYFKIHLPYTPVWSVAFNLNSLQTWEMGQHWKGVADRQDLGRSYWCSSLGKSTNQLHVLPFYTLSDAMEKSRTPKWVHSLHPEKVFPCGREGAGDLMPADNTPDPSKRGFPCKFSGETPWACRKTFYAAIPGHTEGTDSVTILIDCHYFSHAWDDNALAGCRIG